MRLLLLSNSKNYGQGFLDHAEAHIRDFFGKAVGTILFVPFAGVTISYDDYTQRVRERFRSMGFRIQPVHDIADPITAVRNAEALAVGGGNTFHLRHLVGEHELLHAIRDRVLEGVPYIGWSAGANLACPTIKTTNDMPIVEPSGFDALGLVPFQINPHYLDANPEGHQGETREQRLLEFIAVNPGVTVVGLREGSMLRIEDHSVTLLGDRPARLFEHGADAREHAPGKPLDFLME